MPCDLLLRGRENENECYQILLITISFDLLALAQSTCQNSVPEGIVYCLTMSRFRSLAVLRRRWQLNVHDAHNSCAFQHASDLLCIQSWHTQHRARACTCICTWAGVGQRGGEEPEKACQNALPRRCTSVCEAIEVSAACCGDGDDVVDAEGDVGYMDVREDGMT